MKRLVGPILFALGWLLIMVNAPSFVETENKPKVFGILAVVGIVIFVVLIMSVRPKRAGKGSKVTVRPLSHDDVITIEEARKRLKEVEEASKSVRDSYKWRKPKNLPESDNTLLSKCVGVLLPLGMQASVQDELVETDRYENTVHAQSAVLLQEIMLFKSKFQNTGVTQVG